MCDLGEIRCSTDTIKTSDIDVEISKSLILCSLRQYFLLNVGDEW